MRSLNGSIGRDLTWVEQKDLADTYELRDELEDPLARLSFRSTWGSLAFAETAHGDWSFKRMGFLNPHVTARAKGAEGNLVVYHPKMQGGGRVEVSGGPALTWAPGDFWQSRWSFQERTGRRWCSSGQHQQRA